MSFHKVQTAYFSISSGFYIYKFVSEKNYRFILKVKKKLKNYRKFKKKLSMLLKNSLFEGK